jgi:hypothetical protein
MNKFKKAARYVFLGLLILLAIAGIPIVSFLPTRKEMDIENTVKTELVEGKEDTIEDSTRT